MVTGLKLTKIRNSDEILDETGNFERTKNDILDSMFVQSVTIDECWWKLNMT